MSETNVSLFEGTVRNRWVALGTAALVFFGFVFPVNGWAAERQILGQTTPTSLAAAADQMVSSNLTGLQAKAKRNGSVRVIVGLRVPFAAEGFLAAEVVTQQRNEIAVAQSALQKALPALVDKSRAAIYFESIPFVALEVSAAELEQLMAQTAVTDIAEDWPSFPTLAESVPLIGGTTAWASGYDGSGRTVAVLDTGVDSAHPFLAGSVVSEACYSTTNTASGARSFCPGGAASSTATGSALPYATGVCPLGECDHGTHVSGIVAGNNGSLYGVAKNASIIAIQVFSRIDDAAACNGSPSCALSYTNDQIKGLERVYALRNIFNIDSVNMSLGGRRYYDQATCDSANLATKAVIDNLRSVNIATVISSGNNGYWDSMGAPGCISTAVSVGSTWDSNTVNTIVDTVASYSNSAGFLNLLAPGSLITSSIPNEAYASWHGTSMAAPHVAGAWAVLKQKMPSATVSEVLAALTASGVPVTDARNGIVKPRINLLGALSATLATVTPLNVSNLSGASGSELTFVVTVPASASNLVIQTSGGTGDMDLYVQASAPPTVGIFDCVSYSSVNQETCAFANPLVTNYYIMLYGYAAYSGVNLTVSYTTPEVPKYTLGITKVGKGTGTVSSSPPGIVCGTTCASPFSAGSVVSLTALPDVGTRFNGWSGACSGTGLCAVPLNETQNVIASFSKIGSFDMAPILMLLLSD